ncbi:unnamed protein product [Ostreobium quekettii]|uniref:AP2/ERF domain-containing protein n=1 Tax=Ostreobium quekettii TaxID=121088 RepID=A0A8S1IS78_9CHLO|nr:unnamed protein product [Ostreobium quekettii]
MKGHFNGMSREELQRALGVKPMNKSSRFRGVSKKKGKWEAKVMVNRKWAYRELFDTELEAAQAYDAAVWNLKPREARSYVNFKESCPPEVQAYLRALELEESGHSDALLAPVIKGEGPSTMTRSYSNTAPGVGSPIASLNPEWLRSMGGREEALQRYNSAPSPRNLQQMAGAAGSSILMSRNSQPNLAEAPATSPVDLLRLAHAIPSGRKAAMLPPPPPPQLPTPSAGNLGGIPQDHAPRSAMLRPVNQEGILARAAELQRRMGGMDRMSGGQEHPYVGQQNLGSAISEAMLMPAVEARHHSMPADLGRGPLFVRVGSETHLLQGMPGQQGQAQTQRSMSDAGVYLMLRQQDQVGDLSSQPDRLSSIHALANMQGQDPVHLCGRRLETSPFALAASLDQQQQQQPHGGDGRSQQSTGLESWNLGNVMFSDFQMPASHAGVSLPMMNLEQVQSGHGGTAVAIDLASGARHGMGEAAGHVKADPLLLAVGPSNVDRDVVMAGTGGMGQPVTPQGGRQQERYEYPQVRLEDVLVVDPRDPQVHMGNDVDMELVLRSMSEQASLHPMKGPTASATEAHMLSNRPLQLTNDEIMDELMAPPLSGGMMHRRLGR